MDITYTWTAASFYHIKDLHERIKADQAKGNLTPQVRLIVPEDFFLYSQAYFAKCLLASLKANIIIDPPKDSWLSSIKIPEIFTLEGKLLETGGIDPLEGCFSSNPAPGKSPYISGPYPGMYSSKPWTIRQYAGFSTAKESNAFYKDNLKKGQTGLSVAFDLPTHRGHDSDHPNVIGDVGMAGVAIDSILDMRVLFDGIPLDKVSVSMTMNGAVLPIMAMYLAVAKEQGVSWSQLSGTIQNDILKEFMVRNTFIYPPTPSMRIIGDIISFCAQNVPKFNPISISGYHLQEAGASPALELALTLADGLEYVRLGLAQNLSVDEFAPRLSFFFGIGMDYFTEVSKLRAARVLWARLMQKYFRPKDPKSLLFRVHCQTSGWSLAAKDVQNNLARTMLEAMAAVHGGTQSLHTNALDEALALPSVESAKWARDTQLFLQNQADTCNAEFIDPWFGSTFVEKKTQDLIRQAEDILAEMEEHGGMLKSIELGIPQFKIEKEATITQAKIDSLEQKIVGVNYLCQNSTYPVALLSLDPIKNREIQMALLAQLKKERDEKIVQECLAEIESACKNPNQNLLEVMVKAASNKATLGEMSFAMEKIFGRYEKHSKGMSGVYLQTMKQQKTPENTLVTNKILTLVESFEKKFGRRPRIYLVKMGQDGHDRGIKVLASAFADFGFDVDLGPLFQNPVQVAKIAVENDVHLIGVSTLAGGHKQLVPELMKELKSYGREDIKVVVGGIIPQADYQTLFDLGVNSIFGPNSPIPDCVIKLMEDLLC